MPYRAHLAYRVLAAAMLVAFAARPAVAATGYGLSLPVVDPSMTVPIATGGAATPVPFQVATGCAACAFALVHVGSSRVSSDYYFVQFADPASRFPTPIVFYLGTSDSDGATGNVPGGFWSPLHDVWTIAPLAADGTLSGTVNLGGWSASRCNGTDCKPPGSVTVEVGALFEPLGSPPPPGPEAGPPVDAALSPLDGAVSIDAGPPRPRGPLFLHVPAARIPLYRLIGATTIDESVPLPAAVPSDAELYLGAVQSDRISGDNTSLVVNGRGTQLACSDSSAFSATGAGAAWSPIHAHEIAWPPNLKSPGDLHVQLATGGWMAVHGTSVQPGIEVAVDAWAGGSTPGGDLFIPSGGETERVTLDATNAALVLVPGTLGSSDAPPDAVIALVTTSRYASDYLQLQVGDKTLQLGTSCAHKNGSQAGAAYDPVHTDLVLARPTASGGLLALPVKLTIGGFMDQQSTKPDFGITVQFLGALVSTGASDGGPAAAGHLQGCGCAVGGRTRPLERGAIVLLGVFVLLGLVGLVPIAFARVARRR